MINLSLLLNSLYPETQLEYVISGNTALIAALLFIAVVGLGSYLIMRNYRRNFVFEMKTFRENFDHEKMHWEHLRNELNILQAKLSDFEKEKISWGDEKQKLLKTISDLQEQIKSINAEADSGKDDIIIEYYMNQNTVERSSGSVS